MTDTILNALIGLATTVLTTTISTILIPALAKWVSSKTQSEKLKSLISDVSQTVQTSVDMLEQTVVKQLKADGEWNPTAQAQVLETAITEVINNLTTTTRNTIRDEEFDIDQLITRYIESYIQSKKSNQ